MKMIAFILDFRTTDLFFLCCTSLVKRVLERRSEKFVANSVNL